MDDPVKILGPHHRRERHDPDQKLPEFLINIYGKELGYKIMKEHIMLDSTTPKGKELMYEKRHYEELNLIRQHFQRLYQERYFQSVLAMRVSMDALRTSNKKLIAENNKLHYKIRSIRLNFRDFAKTI